MPVPPYTTRWVDVPSSSAHSGALSLTLSTRIISAGRPFCRAHCHTTRHAPLCPEQGDATGGGRRWATQVPRASRPRVPWDQDGMSLGGFRRRAWAEGGERSAHVRPPLRPAWRRSARLCRPFPNQRDVGKWGADHLATGCVQLRRPSGIGAGRTAQQYPLPRPRPGWVSRLTSRNDGEWDYGNLGLVLSRVCGYPMALLGTAEALICRS